MSSCKLGLGVHLCALRGGVPGQTKYLSQENAETSLWRSSLVQGTADGTSYLQCALLFLVVLPWSAAYRA